jgi:hypothetical protein
MCFVLFYNKNIASPVQGVLPTPCKIRSFRINSEWEQARGPNPWEEGYRVILSVLVWSVSVSSVFTSVKWRSQYNSCILISILYCRLVMCMNVKRRKLQWNVVITFLFEPVAFRYCVLIFSFRFTYFIVSLLNRHEEAYSRGTHWNSVLKYCWLLDVLYKVKEIRIPCVEVMSERLSLTYYPPLCRCTDFLKFLYGKRSLQVVEEFWFSSMLISSKATHT